jgi:hypothetical protein
MPDTVPLVTADGELPRVLEKKKMVGGEKGLSLFDLHICAIPRHKGGALVEFGRHVMVWTKSREGS